MKTVIRRQRNRIRTLEDDNGKWIWDEDNLKELAVDFYDRLFTREEDLAPSSLYMVRSLN